MATEPWAPGTKAHWLRVVPSHISGRRIRPDGGQAARRSDHDDPLAGSQTHVGTLARPVTSIPVAASLGDAQVLRLLDALATGVAPGAPVTSVRGGEPIGVSSLTRLVYAAALMLERSAGYVLVMDTDRAPVGFVGIDTALAITLGEVEPSGGLAPPPH